MRRTIFTLIIGLAVGIGAILLYQQFGSGTASKDGTVKKSGATSTYTHPGDNLTVKYPSDWKVQIAAGSPNGYPITVTPPGTAEQPANFAPGSIIFLPTLDSPQKYAKDEATRMPGTKVLSEKSIKLAGHDGYYQKLETSGNVSHGYFLQYPGKLMVARFLEKFGNASYSYTAHVKDFEKIVNSVKLP